MNVPSQHLPAGPSAAATAPPALQPAAHAVPGSSGQQLQLSQGQAELLAQVHMAQNNRAAHAGSSAPAAGSVHLSQALQQHLPGAGVSAHSSAPPVLARTQAAAGAPTQQPSQPAMVAPTHLPIITSLQQQLPVTPTRNRNGASTPRPSGQRKQHRAQQRQAPQQGSSARPAASAQPSNAATMQRAAANERIIAEFFRAPGLQTLPHGPQQQQAHRPNTLQMGIRPDAASTASAAVGTFAQNASPAAVQRMMAALQASHAAAQGRPALPAASSGAVRIVVQQGPALGVSSSEQNRSSQGLVTGQPPSSMAAGQPLSPRSAHFPAPIQLPTQRASDPRPQHPAVSQAAPASARLPGSAVQPPQLHASAARAVAGLSPQQHVSSMVSQPYQSTLPPGVAAKGQAYPMYMWVPDGTTPHSQQQGMPHGQSAATTAMLPPQSQPASLAVAVAQDLASGQRAGELAAVQHPALPNVTGQKRAAEPLSVQDTSAPNRPRTYSAQAPLQLLPQSASGQPTQPAAAQSVPPAMAMPAPSAPSADSAFEEALRVSITNLPSGQLHHLLACTRHISIPHGRRVNIRLDRRPLRHIQCSHECWVKCNPAGARCPL